jgi:hypothetical protein
VKPLSLPTGSSWLPPYSSCCSINMLGYTEFLPLRLRCCLHSLFYFKSTQPVQLRRGMVDAPVVADGVPVDHLSQLQLLWIGLNLLS